MGGTEKPMSGGQREFRYTATLEFEDAQPETVRGTSTVANPRRAAWNALNELFKAHPKRYPSSLVVVLEYPERKAKATEAA
jgi:hypothetical protein